MKTIILTLLFMVNSLCAIELGQFKSYKIKDGEIRLAIIDTSEYSLKWLDKNANYLVTNKIPVMIINAKQEDATRLNKKYVGLLSGIVPEPVDLFERFTRYLSIHYYPAVIEENGIVL